MQTISQNVMLKNISHLIDKVVDIMPIYVRWAIFYALIPLIGLIALVVSLVIYCNEKVKKKWFITRLEQQYETSS